MNITFKVAILKSGLSQRELAKESGIHESIISLAVRGRYLLDQEQKKRIAEALDSDEAELFEH
jgi:transcriptional regulator with XRE-family HTH domain